MKTLTAIAVMSAVATLSVAPVALAQTERAPGATQAPSRSTTTQREAFKAPEGVVDSSKLIGTKVRNSAGKDIGEIDYLLIDTKSAKVTHAVIGRGGVLGVAETKVVVPWSSITLAADAGNRDRLVVTMDQSMLESAPRYDRREAGTDRAPAASPKTEEKKVDERKSTPSR
jgi:sporulation protein YlmC with PRC-barrel domain